MTDTEGDLDFDEKSGDFSALVQNTGTRTIKAGATVFAAGEIGTEFFIVKSGEVEIRTGDRLLEVVGPNEIFGEMALIDQSPRSADAVATTDSEVIALSKRQFFFLVGERPPFALNVMRTMARRLRQTTAAG